MDARRGIVQKIRISFLNLVHKDYDIEVSLWLSMILFVSGVFAPFMTFEKFLIFESTVSISRAISILLEGDKYLLFIVVFMFSVLFPIAKLWTEAIICFLNINNFWGADLKNMAHTLSQLSMVEVFVASIFVTVVKIDLFSKVDLHMGLYLLLGSVITGLWVSWRLDPSILKG